MHALGSEHDLRTLPLLVDIDGDQCFLVRDGSGLDGFPVVARDGRLTLRELNMVLAAGLARELVF